MSETYTTPAQIASYGIGQQIGGQLAEQSFADLDPQAVAHGLVDFLSGKDSAFDEQTIDAALSHMQEKMQEHNAARGAAAANEGEAFLKKNGERDEITVLGSGLQYQVLTEATGDKPSAEATVRTHYHGTLINGQVFDSSVQRGRPAEFPVNGVIAGWTEALQQMSVGAKWRLFVPPHLAYGERGAGGAIGPNTTLIFEVELLAIL